MQCAVYHRNALEIARAYREVLLFDQASYHPRAMDDDIDDLDELELIDQHELEEGDSGTDSVSEDGESGSEEDVEVYTEEQYNQLKSSVLDTLTAMGGLEEELGEDGEVVMVYVLGHQCLRCLRDLRLLWRQDEQNPLRVVPKIFAEVNVLQTGLLPLLLKATEMGEEGHKVAQACSEYDVFSD
jgi:replication fork protection complex subunit Tof1/Swi1